MNEITQDPIQRRYLAVDVSKKELELSGPAGRKLLPNSAEGFAELSRLAADLGGAVVVCEATGGYESALLSAMAAAGTAALRVDPMRARAFARSEGQRAKNDAKDAEMLRRFACSKGLAPQAPRGEQETRLAELLQRRRQLSGMLASEKARRDKSPEWMAQSLGRVSDCLSSEIEGVEALIEQVFARDAALGRQRELLLSISGVGAVTAASVLALVPQIRSMSRGQLSSFAGLAPFDRDSGSKRGKRFIQAGKLKLRDPLYMATVAATRFNPVIRARYQSLIGRGKPSKVALVACMRKLLLHIQSVLKNMPETT